MSDSQVIVIGAGVAGLACARELAQRGQRSIVLERSRGVGGRCATRRIDGQAVDHGAAFFHARSAEFAQALAQMPVEGRIDGWPQRVVETRLACQPEAFGPGQVRFARREGMSAFPKMLAKDLDVRLQHTVTKLESTGDRVRVHTQHGATFEAEFVVAAGSLAQSLRLAEPFADQFPGAAEQFAKLHDLEVVPSFAVIAGYACNTPDPGFEVWNPLETVMLQAIIHDSAKRLAPAHRVLVLHSRPGFARARMGESAEAWSRDMLWELGDVLGEWAAKPLWTQTHTWRSGRIRAGDQLAMPAVLNAPGGGTLLIIGDAFGSQPGFEGAYLSGVAAGEQLARAPERLRLVGR